MNSKYIFRSDGSLDVASSHNEATATTIPSPRFATRRVAYEWFEFSLIYWFITLIIAYSMGSIAGFSILPHLSLYISGDATSDVLFSFAPYLILIGFVVGACYYNLKCANHQYGVYDGSNYVYSALSSLGIGSLALPAAYAVLAIIAIILGIITVIAIIGMLFGIMSEL